MVWHPHRANDLPCIREGFDCESLVFFGRLISKRRSTEQILEALIACIEIVQTRVFAVRSHVNPSLIHQTTTDSCSQCESGNPFAGKLWQTSMPPRGCQTIVQSNYTFGKLHEIRSHVIRDDRFCFDHLVSLWIDRSTRADSNTMQTVTVHSFEHPFISGL